MYFLHFAYCKKVTYLGLGFESLIIFHTLFPMINTDQ
jgi:hypothetical protein